MVASDIDIIVIGSGASGLSAAIEASASGARVKVVEKSESWGGAALPSGGGCAMVDTSLQRKNGIHDTVELALEDWRRWSKGTADMEWARYYVKNSQDLYEWTEKLGVEWSELVHQEGNSLPRWHRPKGAGKELITCIHKESLKAGVTDFTFSRGVDRIVLDDRGRVKGVKLEGSDDIVDTRAIIVATGGFCNNREMVIKHLPMLKNIRFLAGGGLGALGIGHKLLEDVGGVLCNPEDIWIYPYGTPDPSDSERGIAIRGLSNAIWVNTKGIRFHNELLSGAATGTLSLLNQEPPTSWAIIDQSMIKGLLIADPYYRSNDPEIVLARTLDFIKRSRDIVEAESIETLADAMAIGRDNLKITISRYNSFIEGELKIEPDFNKDLTGLRKIEKAPFYAIRFLPLARKNLGGFKTDMMCRVVNQEGNAISGLYASGEVAGMAGGHINGVAGLEGTMLGPSIFSGRVAGLSAASDLGYQVGLTKLHLVHSGAG